MIKKYRQKPVEIEAMLYDGDLNALYDFVGHQLTASDSLVLISTEDGDMMVQRGRYVIKEFSGRFSTCDAKMFEENFEEVK